MINTWYFKVNKSCFFLQFKLNVKKMFSAMKCILYERRSILIGLPASFLVNFLFSFVLHSEQIFFNFQCLLVVQFAALVRKKKQNLRLYAHFNITKIMKLILSTMCRDVLWIWQKDLDSPTCSSECVHSIMKNVNAMRFEWLFAEWRLCGCQHFVHAYCI